MEGLQELLEPGPAQTIVPALHTAPITTVRDVERTKRPISLPECLALALEKGRVGDESIRVLALDPAVAAADIEQAISKFDAVFQSNMTWNRLETPTGLGPFDAVERDTAEFNGGIFKPLPSGGFGGVNLRTNYDLSDANPGFNPLYTPSLQFSFEQPLLRGYGTFINQLLPAHPNSFLNPVAGSTGPGILLARLAFDQSRAEFERQVQELTLQVEQAYWDLYCAYWTLYSRETALRLALQEWQAGKERFERGQFTVQDLAQIEEQVHFLRGERLAALGTGLGRPGVLEAERQLRRVIGLPPEDGDQLVPSDTPTVAPYLPNWEGSVRDALALRPELVRARQEVELAYLAVVRDSNALLPDLRFISRYGINGVGSRLAGPDLNNAFRSLADNRFQDWTVGVRLDVPIGFRDANAQVRRDRLQLAQRLRALKNQEELAVFEVQRAYRDLIEAQDQIAIQAARRLAAARQVKARIEEFRAGLGDINVLLISQRSLADSIRDEQQAICTYNIALAQLERSKGTILTHNNIVINEGPVPESAARRASIHFRDRQRALILREWPTVPADLTAPSSSAGWVEIPTEQRLTPPRFFEMTIPATLEEWPGPPPEFPPIPSTH